MPKGDRMKVTRFKVPMFQCVLDSVQVEVRT